MMERSFYIPTEEEWAFLEKYARRMEDLRDPYRYDTFERESLIRTCRMKDNAIKNLRLRYEAARDVIDGLARLVGIDPENTSYWLYAPDEEGNSHISEKVSDWISRRGEKTQLKKRIDELERENEILQKLLKGGRA